MSNNTPLHVRLALTVDEYISLLTDLYWKQELSQARIAIHLDTHRRVIEQHFKKYAIKTRPYTECDVWARKFANLSPQQYEILDGIMLADGHFERSAISARISYGCKFRETLLDISASFPQLHFSRPWRSKTGYWHFKSSYCRDLLVEANRWYNVKKLVPPDVRITPLSCYWWFVGDGYQVDYGLQLCTDDFTIEDKIILIDKLADLGYRAKVTPSSGRVRICGESAPRFLAWVKETVPVSAQYLYKWGTNRRQKKCPNNV